MDAAAEELRCSPSRISRIESGEIKPSTDDVMQLLVCYGMTLDGEPGASLVALAHDLRASGWWQRLDAISSRYATYIAYEAEATAARDFEPMLIPGLLQTGRYAREVNSVGWKTDAATIDQRVEARLTRQGVLTRTPTPLSLHAVVSEAALLLEVGGPEVLRHQLEHIAKLASRPNITVQILPFTVGATLADRGGFAVLTFAAEDPPLGYVETAAGELFIEAPGEIGRLDAIFDQLKALAMSPAESVKLIRERATS